MATRPGTALKERMTEPFVDVRQTPIGWFVTYKLNNPDHRGSVQIFEQADKAIDFVCSVRSMITAGR